MNSFVHSLFIFYIGIHIHHVYVCVIYAHLYVCVYINAYIRVRVCVYTCICTCIRMFICIRRCISVYSDVCLSIYIYVFIYRTPEDVPQPSVPRSSTSPARAPRSRGSTAWSSRLLGPGRDPKAMSRPLYAIYHRPYIICSIQYTIYCMLYAIYHIVYTVYDIPHLIDFISYAIGYILHSIHHPGPDEERTVEARTLASSGWFMEGSITLGIVATARVDTFYHMAPTPRLGYYSYILESVFVPYTLTQFGLQQDLVYGPGSE